MTSFLFAAAGTPLRELKDVMTIFTPASTTASHVDNEEKFLSAEESKTLDRLFSVGAEKTFSDGKEEILKESASAQDFLSRILGGNQKKEIRNV